MSVWSPQEFVQANIIQSKQQWAKTARLSSVCLAVLYRAMQALWLKHVIKCNITGGGRFHSTIIKRIWPGSKVHCIFYSRSFPVCRSDAFLIGWLRCTEREGGQREASGLSERENCDREAVKKSRGAREPGHFHGSGVNPAVAHHSEILLRSFLSFFPSLTLNMTNGSWEPRCSAK